VRNPLAGLSAPLAALAEEAKVLPASGMAEEYLQRFDLDEHYDRIVGDSDRRVTAIRERPGSGVYVSASPVPRHQDHCFRLFLDGASRITFLGTLVDGARATPVVLAQTGACALERDDDGSVSVRKRKTRLCLVVDRKSLTERAWARLEQTAAVSHVEAIDSAERTEYTDNETHGSTKEPRSRAAHVANWHMRLLELKVLRKVLPDRPERAWLVIDGSLGKEFRQEDEPEGFLGVIKNFTKEVLFELPGGRGAPRLVDLHTLIAKLPVAHRTAVFGRPDGRVAFWYVRLRGPIELDYPLMGVIKVEVPLRAGKHLDSGLVDRLSSCLVAERTVAAPGRDPRWHAHLYPIHLAERAIRAAFVSHTVLRAAVKWPRISAYRGDERAGARPRHRSGVSDRAAGEHCRALSLLASAGGAGESVRHC
jgi:hypothetical protein